jgi:hypothetical protein
MHNFLKIATQMFPAERIESINRNANIGGEIGIEVKLFGITETFQYTGQYASLAYDVLEGINPAPTPPTPSPTIVVTFNGVITPPHAVEISGQEYRFVTVETNVINANDIEWVDFDTTIAPGQQGVELRVATDAPGVTRKLTGPAASAAFDVLVLLASNVESEASATN